MADQNGVNDRLNLNLRKTKNKTPFRVEFESLMSNMDLFFTSVALLSNLITEKTVTTVFFSLLFNTKKLTDSIQNQTKHLLIHFRMVDIKKEINITVIFMISYVALSRLHFFFECSSICHNDVLQRMTLYWIANYLFPLMFSIQYGRQKWQK